MLRTVIQITVLSLLIGVPFGCTTGYNGSWLPEAMNGKQSAKYQGFLKEQANIREQKAAEQRVRNAGVRYDSTGKRSYLSLAKAEQRQAPRPTSRKIVTPKPRDTRFLYGQIRTTGDHYSSPMGGTITIRQVSFAVEGADFAPAIDRTGKWMVYASTQHRVNSDIYVKAIDGTAVIQLTDDPSNDATPVFSPDGQWVAYASDRAGNWDIYLVGIDGGASRLITTNSPADDIHPSFSPDGRQLVYCSRGSQSGQWELVVVDVDKPKAPRTIGYGLFPEWSPVENRIVYQRARENGSRFFGVWTMQLVDGEGVRPTLVAASSNAAVITPSWSADGTAIVFCTIVDPDSDLQEGMSLQADVWMANADGEGRTNLTRSRFANLEPTWAPDGGIYFVSNRGRGGMENIWGIRTETALRVVRTQAGPGPTPLQTQTAAVPTQ